MDMPPLQRRAVTQAIASLERQWRGQHTERHTEGKKSRNAHSRKVRETSAEIVSSAKALVKAVQTGRMTPKQARDRLRDHIQAHARLTAMSGL
jgi:hypothetical protein